MRKISLLPVTTNKEFRKKILNLSSRIPNIRVSGSPQSAPEALRQIKKIHPECVLLDGQVPGASGVRMIRQIRKIDPYAKIVVMESHENLSTARQAIRAGASGYVVTDIPVEDLASGIQAVAHGGLFFSPGLPERLMARDGGGRRGDEDYQPLTDRERDVLSLLSQGYTGKEAASVLGVSPKTVDTHKVNLMRKLNIHNRAELIKFAIRKGIVRLGPA